MKSNFHLIHHHHHHHPQSFLYLLPSPLLPVWPSFGLCDAIGLAPLPQVNKINSDHWFIFSTCCHSHCHLSFSWFHLLHCNLLVYDIIFDWRFLRNVYKKEINLSQRFTLQNALISLIGSTQTCSSGCEQKSWIHLLFKPSVYEGQPIRRNLAQSGREKAFKLFI